MSNLPDTSVVVFGVTYRSVSAAARANRQNPSIVMNEMRWSGRTAEQVITEFKEADARYWEKRASEVKAASEGMAGFEDRFSSDARGPFTTGLDPTRGE